MSIEILNESGYTLINEVALVDCARFVLREMDIHPEALLTISLVGTATMSDLHMQWMDLPGPTDVLSFPMDELTPHSQRPDAVDLGPAMLGDIILCPEFAAQQADKAGHDLAHELALLTVHGCLHLLGYDHIEPREEQYMFALQNDLLRDWYDDCAARGLDFQPRPENEGAFPTAAQRLALDQQMDSEQSIPAIGEQ
ncbi:rRNA maturation RNase YbeY [Corynebacterium sp. ES2794-CONJ1]|uniref:rRNA maturation RNase YbeY n=1 Tax=unclassified Corynebacterium TaxID=2624378 RepID=UPI0021679060|nr:MULTISPECIES: rRNA maturation RNase YbeY [unclassified Corynebacterium]MCS4490580.1 rRNA maturation RNase YbeY [Corynebacterium sp. ES2775-CONJ]MCS4492359.1 rRNA maturation RNase YbeY [Corynebacterium sp. ES2715-CONJ3]MCS4532449.1 rRNA maturation RNase YbeY [Corynebacterium sp. ES2730-CONJ]MCU9519844.1 rRNA maturation RNase YbeY [Corynebacterium sp. ES2794-CONJ1]